MREQKHLWHLVDVSPWPYVGVTGVLGMAIGGVMYFQGFEEGEKVWLGGIIVVIMTMIVWWRDVIREGTYRGDHTERVQKGLRLGMILFIVSEVLFFFSFFWAYFNSALGPGIEIGGEWPPLEIKALKAWEVPLLNTVVLLTSGMTVTWSHNEGQKIGKKGEEGLLLTIILGIYFTCLQGMEYMETSFTISDSVYGSTFYVATGFHGLHVLIGTTILIVCLVRMRKNHNTIQHQNGYEAGIWYWHFVDYVWIFLYICIYWWGG